MELAHTVRSVFLGLPFLLRGRPRERAGEERLASRRLGAMGTELIPVEPLAFSDNGPIPVQYTLIDGDNVIPPLRWSSVPEGTRALVLMVEDPDAPTPNPFVHWIAVLPPEARSIGHRADPIRAEGRTTMLRSGWVGCAPPKGDVPHRYHFQLFALDEMPKLGKHPGRSEIIEAMRGHVIGFGEVVGTYQRLGRGLPERS